MELWIRSQNKQCLMKVVKVDLDNDKTGVFCYSYDDMALMGKYRTKERALEILDEIQRILQPRLIANVRATKEMEELIGSMSVGKTLKQDIDIKQLSTVVYEMPKE